MEAFLESVAKKLYEEHGNKISRLHIVLPSKRACVYFKHYLGEMMNEGQVLIAPVIVSMEGFARILAHLQIPDSITLLFDLYKTFLKHHEEITLDKFAPLGSAILREFNMIDNNLTEEKAVEMFEYLEDAKAIDRWAENLDKDHDEIKQKHQPLTEFLSFWKSLRETYVEFRANLLERKIGYGGLAFRTAFNRLEEAVKEEGIENVIFAGFSQTSTIEKELILKLVDMGIAKTYFDCDAYYLDQPHHEAGLFLQDFKKHQPQLEDFKQEHIGKHKMDVEIIQVSNIPTQAKVVGDLLQKELDGLISENRLEEFTHKLNHTAILLPDESLLQPLLHSLPDELEGTKEKDIAAKNTNITMGFAFHQTPLYELVESIFNLQENLKREEGKVAKAYFRDVVRIVRHPYFQRNVRDKEIAQGILKQIQQEKHIFLEFETLLEWSDQSPLYRAVFFDWEEKHPAAIRQLKRMTEGLAKVFKNEARTPEEAGADLEGENAFENELLLKLFGTLNRLDEVLPPENIQLKTFRIFLLEALYNITMPFTGFPIAPIQIMGMLESRSLDFDHVIVLSCNEGKLPVKKSVESIIPFDLKSLFGLPTFKDNDKSFAYTFYRLMHRAKKMTLIYTDSSNELTGGGEKSRFLLQIEKELAPRFRDMISVKNSSLAMPLPQIKNELVEIKKDEALIDRIKERLTEKPISPSSIQKYLKNPLQFLEDVVIKLEDDDEIEEELDFRTFGTLLHGGLELLLKPFVGKTMNAEQWTAFKKGEIELALDRTIRETKDLNYFSLESGKNYLLFQIAQKLTADFFTQQSKEFSKVKIVALEDFYHSEILITPDLKIKLAGQADRVDLVWKHDGSMALRVVDYKTGNFTKKDLESKIGIQEVLDDPKKNKIIQLLAYKYLLLKNLNSSKLSKVLPPHVDVSKLKIESGFYFFRKLNDGFIQYKLEGEPDTTTEREAFFKYTEEFFRTIVLDMISEDKNISEEAPVIELVNEY
ncbi:PD-(D/E)XK nuclease family protein [Sediminitomix flava]|uniref:PD-(D/E)XK nuclease superfamily protein n=1 Tax=Sediminitomix flava TaxID=379075 RepID=A0A315ZGT2_SEDFL|nr:PD-(D/E)XK nuclease family protein [Sediminitomix flava]PWJ44721.1 PD-(D/E)XK nuclease superfamily protein [Sediminitomix flava]